jgi:hypothetical protein
MKRKLVGLLLAASCISFSFSGILIPTARAEEEVTSDVDNEDDYTTDDYDEDDGYYDEDDYDDEDADEKDAASVVAKSQTIKIKKTTISIASGEQKFSIGASAKTSLSYKVVNGSKYMSVSKWGKVTVKKGIPTGKYKIQVTAKAR